MPPSTNRVLCVDLDGTLVSTDLVWESAVSAVRRHPRALFRLPLWLLRGRAYFKQQLAAVSAVDFATLPYRSEVLAFVDRERQCGRPVVLTTAADHSLGEGVSRHLGLFSEVMASDGVTNLDGTVRAASLTGRFGRGNFDYVGDSRADIPCWESAGVAISVLPDRNDFQLPYLLRLDEAAPSRSPFAAVLAALRPHQWAKNLLMLVPALAAHRLDVATGVALFVAVLTMSLSASGGYVLNDLLDVTADRQHVTKRNRPFASGRLSLAAGVWLIFATWLVGFGLAALMLPGAYTLMLVGYLVATVTYSIRLKTEPVLDVVVLAGLYVLRVVAGGVATGVPVSNWLLAFTLFISLSLAFLKRFIEVNAIETGGEIPGRAYIASDAFWLHSAGLCSAFLGVLVLAIYATNADLVRLYSNPDRLLLICPLLLYWATRTWFKAHRRQLHDDPVIAVARDPSTYVVGVITLAIVLAAI
jgi:4-hydroxybenzoate polyprenyltransferase